MGPYVRGALSASAFAIGLMLACPLRAEAGQTARALPLPPDLPVRAASGPWDQVLASLAEDAGVLVVTPEPTVTELTCPAGRLDEALASLARQVGGEWLAVEGILALRTADTPSIRARYAPFLGPADMWPDIPGNNADELDVLVGAADLTPGLLSRLARGESIRIGDLTEQGRAWALRALADGPFMHGMPVAPGDAMLSIRPRPTIILYDEDGRQVEPQVSAFAGEAPRYEPEQIDYAPPDPRASEAPPAGRQSVRTSDWPGATDVGATCQAVDAVSPGLAEVDEELKGARLFISSGEAEAWELLTAMAAALHAGLETRDDRFHLSRSQAHWDRAWSDLWWRTTWRAARLPWSLRLYEAAMAAPETAPFATDLAEDPPFRLRDFTACHAVPFTDLTEPQRECLTRLFGDRVRNWADTAPSLLVLLSMGVRWRVYTDVTPPPEGEWMTSSIGTSPGPQNSIDFLTPDLRAPIHRGVLDAP